MTKTSVKPASLVCSVHNTMSREVSSISSGEREIEYESFVTMNLSKSLKKGSLKWAMKVDEVQHKQGNREGLGRLALLAIYNTYHYAYIFWNTNN